jgi:hypothetical protein
VSAAFQKFLSATTFRLTANATVSPSLFQPQYSPQPGDDPNLVTVVSMQGGQDNENFDYKLRGFAASFLALVAGFDPNSQELELAAVDGARFARAVKEGETTAKWYRLPEDDTATTGFSPEQLLSPIIDPQYPETAFTASGTETMDQMLCGVFQGTRAAFDAALPGMSDSALLNTDVFDAGTIDSFSYRVWVCADGNIHRVNYAFDAHTRADASKEGSFAFDVLIKDYDGAIVIRAPADAIPFETSGAGTTPTAEASPTAGIAKTFSSLEGEWEGASAEDSIIQFSVEDNAVTFANLNYSINTGSCSVGGAYGTSVDDAPIEDSTFRFELVKDDELTFTVTGEFSSNNDASGTLAIKGKTFCGDTDIETTWTAKHISSPDDESSAVPVEQATDEPTEEPTAEATPGDTAGASGAAVVNSVFAALANKDVAAALAAFDDDVVYNVGGTSGVGKASLQSYMQLAVAAGASFAASNMQDLGGVLTFTVTVSGIGAGTYSNSSAIVEDGKIVIFTIQ